MPILKEAFNNTRGIFQVSGTTAVPTSSDPAVATDYVKIFASKFGPVVVTATSGTGSVATLTFSATVPTIPVGTIVTVKGLVPVGYNGTYQITASSSTSIAYANTTSGSMTTAGSFSSTYETSFRRWLLFNDTGSAIAIYLRLNSLPASGVSDNNYFTVKQNENFGDQVDGKEVYIKPASTSTAGTYRLNLSEIPIRSVPFSSTSTSVSEP